MTKTTAELAAAVLERLFPEAAATPTTADVQKVQTFYADTFAELQAMDLVYWDVSSVPDEAFAALTDLIAGRIGIDFGVPKPDLEASGTARLATLSSQGPTGLPVAGSYF